MMIEQPSTGASLPTVLLDTCVISGAAKGDMSPDDTTAFCRMAELVAESNLTVWASTVAKEEIDKIPTEYRQGHLDEYNALRIIRRSDATWIDDDPGSTGFGEVVQHPQYAQLHDLLRDENDARLIFQAKMAGVNDFITVDYRSILNKATELEEQFDMKVLSPSQYMSNWST